MNDTRQNVGVVRWLALAATVVVASGAAGWWLATVTAPRYESAAVETPGGGARAQDIEADAAPGEAYVPPEPPLYFYAPSRGGADRDLVGQEMRMALQAGIRNIILSAELSWEADTSQAAVLGHVEWIKALNPQTRIFMELVLDPSLAWLAAHPDDTVTVDSALPYASVASEAWRAEVISRLETLARALAEMPEVQGIVLACQEQGQWSLASPWDASAANTAGFRRWLTARYSTDNALQEAWNDPNVSLETAESPHDEAEEPATVVASDRDYLAYLSDMRADTIQSFALAVKTAHEDLEVWVRYGQTLSAPDAASGQFALARVLDSPIDGLVLSMAALDRGLGGSGGYAAPIHSILANGKRCILIDDTYTGLAKNAETGELERVRGMSYESVSQIHHRNFASALVYGIGVAWADPEGDGRLHDAELWEQFAAMRAMYGAWYEHRHAFDAADATTRGVAFPPGGPGLAIIVDERNRLDDSERIQAALLASIMDAALRSGVPLQVWLLDDFLQGHVTEASVVLFANCFVLTEADRAQIHERIKERGSAAVWAFVPGSTGMEGDAAANVSALVGMTVKVFDAPIASGSTYALDSHWIRAGETFAGDDAPHPRFYVDDANADILATYNEGGAASVALATTPDGWASIFVGEARLSPQLLHEILQLLDVFTVSRDYESAATTAFFLGPHLLALHTAEAGATTLYFGTPCDIQDAVDPLQGWLAKSSLKLPTAVHDTRIFSVIPAAALPEGSPEDTEDEGTTDAGEADGAPAPNVQ